MRISPDGQLLIKHFEQCRLKAYPDPGTGAAPWTIGWGHTGPEVRPGLVWTQAQADEAFLVDVSSFEDDVTLLLSGRVTPQCQFDALVSFAYNVGSDIDQDSLPEGLGDSTLLKMLLAGRPLDAANEFLKWDKAKGVRMWGLAKRRTAERTLFLGGDVAFAIAQGERVPRP